MTRFETDGAESKARMPLLYVFASVFAAAMVTLVTCETIGLRVAERIFGPFWLPGERRDIVLPVELRTFTTTYIVLSALVTSMILFVSERLSKRTATMTYMLAASGPAVVLATVTYVRFLERPLGGPRVALDPEAMAVWVLLGALAAVAVTILRLTLRRVWRIQ